MDKILLKKELLKEDKEGNDLVDGREVERNGQVKTR